MKVSAFKQTRLSIEPLDTEFNVKFVTTKKRGVNKNYWFTDSGTCKVYFGSLNPDYVGDITPEDANTLRNVMIKAKSDILAGNTLRDEYYTLTSDGISHINIGNILDEMIQEYNIRFQVY
jgi:hypothetical protein